MAKRTLALLFCLLPALVWAACDSTINSGASIATALGSVPNGGTLCLNAGTYSYNATVTKTSMTTIRPADGVARSAVTLSTFATQGSQYLNFQGMTIAGGDISANSPGGAASINIEVRGNNFTSGLCIYQPQNVYQNILVDGNEFRDLEGNCNEGRIGVRGLGVTHNTTRPDVTISNNICSGNGGNGSDCIQLTQNAYGILVEGNEAYGIIQADCNEAAGVHCDPIQTYGANYVTIRGNYFHDNSTGMMLGTWTNGLVENNVVYSNNGEYPHMMVLWICGDEGHVIRHNTVAEGANIRFVYDNCSANIFHTVTDNIADAIVKDANTNWASANVSYNLTASPIGYGTNNIVGTPTFVGGATPTTYVGYALATGSAGENNASDGLDRGINITASGPAAPANFRLVLFSFPGVP